jgi:hypothetical protein
MSDDIEYGVYSLPAALMLQHKLDEQVVTALNDYLDDLRSNEERKSAADSLVGQIHHGEQLQMDYSHPDLARFIKIVESLSIVYIKHFVEQTRSQLRPKRVATDKLWSVHSFAGDYNPIHDHTTTAPMGISFTTYKTRGWLAVDVPIVDATLRLSLSRRRRAPHSGRQHKLF